MGVTLVNRDVLTVHLKRASTYIAAKEWIQAGQCSSSLRPSMPATLHQPI